MTNRMLGIFLLFAIVLCAMEGMVISVYHDGYIESERRLARLEADAQRIAVQCDSEMDTDTVESNDSLIILANAPEVYDMAI